MVFPFVYFVLHARAFRACLRVQFFCMAWLNPPTEEGLSPKRLVSQNKFDNFQSISALNTTHMSVLLIPTEFKFSRSCLLMYSARCMFDGEVNVVCFVW